MYVLAALQAIVVLLLVVLLLSQRSIIKALTDLRRPPAMTGPQGLPGPLRELQGRRLPPVDVLDTRGHRVTLPNLEGEESVTIGLFDAACEPCHERGPALTKVAGKSKTIAIITGQGSGLTELMAKLDGVEHIVVGAEAAKISTAWDTPVRPTFIELGDGIARRVGLAVDALVGSPASAS